MKILITDGDNRSSLAATRSLGRKGHMIIATGSKDKSLSSVSRYCANGCSVPDPLFSGVDYQNTILKLIMNEEIDVVFPMTEASIFLLNQIRNDLPSNVILCCETAEKMKAVSDKVSLFHLAEKLGVPIPRTIYLTSTIDLPRAIKRIEQYPVVIKPSLSRIHVGNSFLSGGVRYANSQEELERIYSSSPDLRYPSLIQEKVHGPGTGLFTLFAKKDHVALFSHQRIREKPPSGGVSVVSESVPLDEEMVSHAKLLLSAVEWESVAMVEFKRDIRDGKAKLMEINGRFWGTLQLAITCGVDFPSLYLDFLQGRKAVNTFSEYKIGHKMKWFFGTLDHLLIRMKNKDVHLNLPTGSPSKWRALIEFATIWEKDTSFDVIQRDDLRPFLFESLNYFRQ